MDRGKVRGMKGAGAGDPPVTPLHRDWPRKFLHALGQTGNVSRACEAAGISRLHAYRQRRQYPTFARRWKNALAKAADRLEAEAWRRAVRGIKVPVYQGGTLAGYRREYSDQLLVTLLKAARPGKFADRSKVEHAVPARPVVDADMQRRLLADPEAAELMGRLEAIEAKHRALPAPD